MKTTTIAAVSLMLTLAAAPSVQAQSGGLGAKPAEYPPTSYTGRQYVDSRGCVFIRAGIDGNVNWVPRVSRARKQLCGAQPTNVAGARKTPASIVPELITLEPQNQPIATVPETRPQAPIVRTERTPASTSTGPAVIARPKPQPIPAPVPRRVPVAKPATPATPPVPAGAGRCPGASAISQQYIGSSPGVRCGPQKARPSGFLLPNTRIMPAHVYQERQKAADVEVPEGYRVVWEDDRLNPRRAERTPRAAQPLAPVEIPAGYTRTQFHEQQDRFNPMRGVGSAAGDVQMQQIWTDTLPRRLIEKPLDRPTFKLSQQYKS